MYIPTLILFDSCPTLRTWFGCPALGLDVLDKLLIFFGQDNGTWLAFMPFLLAKEAKVGVASRAVDVRSVGIPDDGLGTLLVDTPSDVRVVLEVVEHHELQVLLKGLGDQQVLELVQLGAGGAVGVRALQVLVGYLPLVDERSKVVLQTVNTITVLAARQGPLLLHRHLVCEADGAVDGAHLRGNGLDRRQRLQNGRRGSKERQLLRRKSLIPVFSHLRLRVARRGGPLEARVAPAARRSGHP